MYLSDYPTYDDGLGSFWTKIRDKVIKPVVRGVAAYYTGGASEAVYKGYEAQEAKKRQEEAYKKQVAEIQKQNELIAAAGNTYPPAPTMPAYATDGRMVHMGAGGPVPAAPQYGIAQYAQPSALVQNPALAQVTAPPGYSIMPVPAQPATKLPEWAIPVGVGAVVLAAVLASRR